VFSATDQENASVVIKPDEFIHRLKNMDPNKRDPLPLHVLWEPYSNFKPISNPCIQNAKMSLFSQMGVVASIQGWSRHNQTQWHGPTVPSLSQICFEVVVRVRSDQEKIDKNGDGDLETCEIQELLVVSTIRFQSLCCR